MRPPSIAQAVLAVPFFVVPLHRFLVATDGSSCKGDTPFVDAPSKLSGLPEQIAYLTPDLYLFPPNIICSVSVSSTKGGSHVVCRNVVSGFAI